MTAQTLTGTEYEELATRESNDIRVSLMWNRATNGVVVSVYDASVDSAFEIEVGDASPLEDFHHPFAFAAFRGITRDPHALGASVDAVAA